MIDQIPEETMRLFVLQARRFTILLYLLLCFFVVHVGKCEALNVISGYVIDAVTGRPIEGALVSLDSEQRFVTDSNGYFIFEVESEGWHTVYAFHDLEDTPGIDYVPSRWRIYLEKGTNVYRVISLWPGASIEVEGMIRFVESSNPASWFRYKVKPPGGTTWGDAYCVNEYGRTDYSRELGLEPSTIIVPSNIGVEIEVEASFPDDLYKVFSLKNKTQLFNLNQGDHVKVQVEEKCLELSTESLQELMSRTLNLLNRAEAAGFLVNSEHKDFEKAISLLNASQAAIARGSFNEALALLRNCFISVNNLVGRLNGLLDIGAQSAIYLTFFFAFVALTLAFLLGERELYLEIAFYLKKSRSIRVPIRPLLAVLSYTLIVSVLYTFYPGSRLVPLAIRLPGSKNPIIFPLFPLISALSFMAASLAFMTVSHLLKTKRSEDRAVSVGGAIAAAFAISCGNLRRRKLRTTLNILCLVIVVFGFIVLTSISPGYGFISKIVGPSKRSLNVLMIVNPSNSALTDFVPLSKDFVVELQENFKTNLIAPKAENLPSFTSLGRVYAPSSGRNSLISGVLGIIPEAESQITGLNTIVVAGEYLKGQVPNQVLISESLAKSLDVSVGGYVLISDRNFTVAGIFSAESLKALQDLNGDLLLPSRLQATPGGTYLTPCQSSEVVIMNFEAALAFPNVAVSRVYIQTSKTEDLLGLGDIIALTRGCHVWASFNGTLYQKYVGPYVEEAGISLMPPLMILGILSVGSTMLGSVYERRQLIFTLSSIGLNPTHIGALFMAESMVIGMTGGGLGYLLGLIGYRTIGVMGTLEVREKVSMEWSLMALSLSMLTAVLAMVIPAVKASTLVTPSQLRRWMPEEHLHEEGEPWIIELPVKIRPGEVDFFCAYIERRLSESVGSLIERVENIKFLEEEMGNVAVKKITFTHISSETKRQLRTNNELIVEQLLGDGYYRARLISFPDRNFKEAVLKTNLMIRRLILEWTAQKVAVITPFESSLNQLYSLVNFYNPEVLYVVADEDASEKIEQLKRRLDAGGMAAPKIVLVKVNPDNLEECMKVVEEYVEKAGFVCVSGDSPSICVIMALVATKLRKGICYVAKASTGASEPFGASKVITINSV